MERIMSVEDKIKRAEEIYYKRRAGEEPRQENIRLETKEKKDIKLLKKMIKQIIVCLIIYSIFYMITNNNYIFSEDFTNKAKEILEQDINFNQIYSVVSNKITEWLQPKREEDKVKENIQNNDENIGGAVEELTDNQENVENINEIQQNEENLQDTNQVQLTQEEQDINYIKESISFIKPVEGTISSEFGSRNPTTSTVPKNHTGTDIAATVGTKIISATDGTVILSSSQGDYGNHLKIQINDVIIVYAHCNKLYVKEGDTIKQGQEIAEVGSTGNATGPHLHFEIRYQNKYIDPQKILEL